MYTLPQAAETHLYLCSLYETVQSSHRRVWELRLSEPLYKCIAAYGYGTVEKRSQLVRQFESRDREFKVKLLKYALLF